MSKSETDWLLGSIRVNLIQVSVQPLMFAGSIRVFLGMRGRTTMTATIAVDDFVPPRGPLSSPPSSTDF
jgi:hypothetical protein